MSEILDNVADSMDRRLGSVLMNQLGVEANIIEEAIAYQNTLIEKRKTDPNTPMKKMGEVLIGTGLVSRDKVYRALAMQKGLPFMTANEIKGIANYKLYRERDFLDISRDGDVSSIIRAIFETQSFPSHFESDVDSNGNEVSKLVIVATNPDYLSSIKLHYENLLQNNVLCKVVLTDNSVFKTFTLKYNAITAKELKEFCKYVDGVVPWSGQAITTREILQYMLCLAILEDVSDIHISPSSDGLAKIAFRKFNTVETQFYISYNLYANLIHTVKITAHMKENVLYVPQDGRIDGEDIIKDVSIKLNRDGAIVNHAYGIDENSVNYDFSSVSFRISTYPTEPNVKLEIGNTFEKLVIRVLNMNSGLVELSELGLSEQTVAELNTMKNRTQGIVLIVGPTGSGKSTTLYSTLNSINSIARNIITFEDPVEMRQLYWTQGQRKVVENSPENNFDFKEANKAILRQDPDIIMMAEVRDTDTAEFTIAAANTGHLVFTTVHANSAASAVERLKKLGVSELDAAMSILCIMSQRLVKKLCPHCRIQRQMSEQEVSRLLRFDEITQDEIPSQIFVAKKGGCKFCSGRGYIGRVTINEIIPFNKEMKRLILSGVTSELEIRELANKQGYLSLLQDGVAKSSKGICDINDMMSAL